MPSRTRTHRRRPGPRSPRSGDAGPDTRAALFQAAAAAFSERGFDGVSVDAIARRAGVNKAMLYYHFRGKLALYREIVRHMLAEAAARLAAVADLDDAPDAKIRRFVHAFMTLTEERPWFPRLMLREMAEGAPHLDVETLSGFRAVLQGFTRILSEGQRAGVFRTVNPVLAYLAIVGPLLLNLARERAGAAAGRSGLSMLAPIPRAQLRAHLERTALCVVSKG
ncbi:MAG TPA: TetR/AcrR family transcriptional regulator [Vicinamibacterales bacterium]|nr:TetR/AcrR family transcriptional regulator [Vicinamibacterales bacterium]